MVDNVPFTELPLAPEEKLLFRTPIVNNFEGRIQSTEVILKCQDGNLIVRAQHDKKSDSTKIECGKRKEVRTGKKL